MARRAAAGTRSRVRPLGATVPCAVMPTGFSYCRTTARDAPVAHRTFTDPVGHAWHVWAVRPSPRAHRPTPAAAFAPGYADGWLVFERPPTPPVILGDLAIRDPAVGDPAVGDVVPGGAPGTGLPADKRRYAPIPAGWDRATDAQLAAWLAAAAPVLATLPRRAPPAGSAAAFMADPSRPPA